MFENLQKDIFRSKKKIIKDISKRVNPYMWESGFVRRIGHPFDFKSEPVILFCFPDRKKYIDGNLEIISSYKVGSLNIEGFTKYNEIITDSYGGGMLTQSMTTISIEDLIKLHKWVLNRYDFKNKKYVQTLT